MLKDNQPIQRSKLLSAILLATTLGIAGCGGGGDGDNPFASNDSSSSGDTTGGLDNTTDEVLTLSANAAATSLEQGDTTSITLNVSNSSSESKTFNPSAITYSSDCITSGQSTLKLETTSTSTTQAKFTYAVNGCSSNDKVSFKLDTLSASVNFSITDDVLLSLEPATPSALAPNSSQSFILKFVNQNDDPIEATGSLSASSDCKARNLATISEDESASNENSKTFEYTVNGCPGEAELDADGNVVRYIDTVVFKGTLNGQSVSKSINLELTPDVVSAIQLDDVSSPSLAVKGTGGVETAVVSFKVIGESGGIVIGQTVNFELLGPGTLLNDSAISDNQGIVQAKVSSTYKAATLTVKALHPNLAGPTIPTASIVVAQINPTDSKTNMSLDIHNLQAWNKDGGPTVNVKVSATDRAGIAVIDGTTIQFYSDEAGQIDPYCSTENGECSVTWSPRSNQPADGRVQLFAYVKGNEDFIDNNSNDVFDDGDGFDTSTHDKGEPFADNNNNGVWDAGERFIDTQTTDDSNATDGLRSSGDFKWNGTNCKHSTLCGDVSFINIGVQAMLVISRDFSPTLCSIEQEFTTLAPKANNDFTFHVSDGNSQAPNSSGTCATGNSLPANSVIKLEVSGGSVSPDSITVENNVTAPNGVTFNYTAPEELGPQTVSIIVSIPGKADALLKTWTVNVQ